ncbi:MAG TPA: CapA family protein [Caulobacteraceae bacterium]|nr:CapA family protein [Caulobacteraceae bacterium]
MDDTVLLYAVGDVAPDRPDPSECFALVRDTLRQADVAFCQLEANITERGERLPQCRHTHRASLRTGQALRDAGFSVVSFAGNHCMDWGRDGFSDTIDNLQAAGLAVVGVGATISQAREPAIVTVKGRRVAFLAYSSILPMGYWAEDKRPGCAPMRAWTHYEQVEHDQPGTPARIHTFAHREDLDALRSDIAEAKTKADVVIVSLHWGIHFIPAVIADYQREVGHAAVDAGADLVLGHHAHILKGAEVYRGKTIFYSLCNFAMDLRMDPAHAASKGFREIQALHPRWEPDFDSLYNFPDDSRMTAVVKAVIGRDGLGPVSVLPAYINRNAQPEILKSGDPRFSEVVGYLGSVTQSQALNARYIPLGDEVQIQEG